MMKMVILAAIIAATTATTATTATIASAGTVREVYEDGKYVIVDGQRILREHLDAYRDAKDRDAMAKAEAKQREKTREQHRGGKHRN